MATLLGLVWMPHSDVMGIKFNGETIGAETILTKLVMLSLTSQIFDPLGLLAPFVVRFKVLLQSLWKEQLGWDDPVPSSISDPFRVLLFELPRVKEFAIRRPYMVQSGVVRRELFGFCDASVNAYSAVVYLRTVNFEDQCDSYIVCTKTRVAPLKSLTIHRLELMAAQLLSKSITRISSNLGIHPENVFCFSDSQVTLCWHSKAPENWQVFVANRVRVIQAVLPISHWAYIRTHDNPADLPSRGITIEKLLNSTLWSQGPLFLANPAGFECLKSDAANVNTSVLKMCQSKVCLATTKVHTTTIFDRFSPFSQLRAVVGWLLRFTENVRSQAKSDIKRKLAFPFCGEALSSAEYDRATIALLCYTQQLAYPNEFVAVSKEESIGRHSPLYTLQPFIDAKGLLRITECINNPALLFEKQHPIILPAHSWFVELFIEHIHNKYFHANRGFVKSFLANKFWLVG